jgi:hypothetical protein
VFEDSMIDVNALVVSFGVKSIALPDIDGDQSDEGKDNHGNEACQLTQDDGEKDETEKGYTDGDGSEGEKPASDAHELQRLLNTLIYGVKIFHRS